MHIIRNNTKYKLLKSILQGKVLGERGPGRRRISWLKNYRAVLSASVNKVIIARMIANIRNN
jgi:hypothetical protein